MLELSVAQVIVTIVIVVVLLAAAAFIAWKTAISYHVKVSEAKEIGRASCRERV